MRGLVRCGHCFVFYYCHILVLGAQLGKAVWSVCRRHVLRLINDFKNAFEDEERKMDRDENKSNVHS